MISLGSALLNLNKFDEAFQAFKNSIKYKPRIYDLCYLGLNSYINSREPFLQRKII